MRQVPKKNDYLIIGSGRLATHLSFYFKSLNITFQNWNRQSNTPIELDQSMSQSRYTLLCISDSELPTFCEHFSGQPSQLVHFSGALEIEGVYGFHPLMTFSLNTYDQEIYPTIAFVGTEPLEAFQKTFPQLKNPYTPIQKNKKALYHSLCVLSGNGTTLLWDLALKQFEEIGLTRESALPFLKQVTENIVNQPPGHLTGPWYRRDQATVEKHLQELKNSPLNNIYKELNTLAQTIGDLP